jgi:hypothetical protein
VSNLGLGIYVSVTSMLPWLPAVSMVMSMGRLANRLWCATCLSTSAVAHASPAAPHLLLFGGMHCEPVMPVALPMLCPTCRPTSLTHPKLLHDWSRTTSFLGRYARLQNFGLVLALGRHVVCASMGRALHDRGTCTSGDVGTPVSSGWTGVFHPTLLCLILVLPLLCGTGPQSLPADPAAAAAHRAG